jgi:hypothetical protein
MAKGKNKLNKTNSSRWLDNYSEELSINEYQDGGKLKQYFNLPTKRVAVDNTYNKNSLKLDSSDDKEMVNRLLREKANESQKAKEKRIADVRRLEKLNQKSMLETANAKDLYDIGEGMKSKYRLSNEDNFFDDYINPLNMIGGMAGGLTQTPELINQGEYLNAALNVVTPLTVGALAGIGTQNAGQFVNNLVNPLTGVKNPFKGKSFKSEIDWGKWNKEIPKNSELIKEYNAIEQIFKANGTWMKNSDGSAFQGTPEQFVQQNSKNFKKAFGDSKLVNPNGSPTIYYHGSPKKFDTFDEGKFGTGNDDGLYGKGIYTSPDKYVAKSYSYENMFDPNRKQGEIYELYVNSKNPGYVYKNNERVMPTGMARDFNRNINNDIDKLNYDLLDVKKPGSHHEVVIPFKSNPKSAIGNNGMFNMTNPNIYKSLIPIGLGAVSQIEEFDNGGKVKSKKNTLSKLKKALSLRENLGNLDTKEGYFTPLNQLLRTAVGIEGKDYSNEPMEPLAREQDALRMYLGLPSRTGAFEQTGPNKYRIRDYNKLYPDTLLSDEAVRNWGIPNEDGVPDPVNPAFDLYPYDDFVMGKHYVTKGKDAKGEYLKYSDRFDFDPTRYANQFIDRNINPTMGKYLKKATPLLDELESLMFNPFELEDKIYYDPKTKLRSDIILQQNAPKVYPGQPMATPPEFAKGGKVNDNNGYLISNLDNFTPKKIINSNYITTNNMAFPVEANGVVLYPNTGDYVFPTNKVTEIPIMKDGGQHGGLDRWFAEKWVDVKTGKECGRQKGEKRKGYPACRPSKRISSDTPKTASELSSAEKEKFKREKTSSKRIDYSHKKEDGGLIYNDMKNKFKKYQGGGYLNYQDDYKGFGVGPQLYQDNSYFRSVMPTNIENMEEEINKPSVFSGINDVLGAVNQGVSQVTGLMSQFSQPTMGGYAGMSADAQKSFDFNKLLNFAKGKTGSNLIDTDLESIAGRISGGMSGNGQVFGGLPGGGGSKGILQGMSLLGQKNGGYLKQYENGGEVFKNKKKAQQLAIEKNLITNGVDVFQKMMQHSRRSPLSKKIPYIGTPIAALGYGEIELNDVLGMVPNPYVKTLSLIGDAWESYDKESYDSAFGGPANYKIDYDPSVKRNDMGYNPVYRKYQDGGSMDMLPVGYPEYIHKSNVFHENYNPVPRVHFSDDTTPYDMGVNLNDLVNMNGGRINKYQYGGRMPFYSRQRSPRVFNSNANRASAADLESAYANDFMHTKVRKDRQSFEDDKVDWGFMDWAKEPVGALTGVLSTVPIVGDITQSALGDSFLTRTGGYAVGRGVGNVGMGAAKVIGGAATGNVGMIGSGIGDVGEGVGSTIGTFQAKDALSNYDKSGYVSGNRLVRSSQDFGNMMDTASGLFGNIKGGVGMVKNMGGLKGMLGNMKGGATGMKGFGNIMGKITGFGQDGGYIDYNFNDIEEYKYGGKVSQKINKKQNKTGWLDQL